jgi:8-oxo-dGTP diphosphatase
MEKKSYVVGFLFGPYMDKVILIKKKRPDWQKGKYNGVGGHIEGDEGAHSAMVREFEEEAGITIPVWNLFCTLKNEGWTCYFFYAVSEKYYEAATNTDEEISIIDVDDIQYSKVIDNLKWLIPMCKDPKHEYCVATATN